MLTKSNIYFIIGLVIIIGLFFGLYKLYHKGYKDGKNDCYISQQQSSIQSSILREEQFDDVSTRIEQEKKTAEDRNKNCIDFLALDIPANCLLIHKSQTSK